MQVVINISETLKDIADKDDIKTFSHFMWQCILIDAIKNGTPLPKGHGRLIDVDKLKEELKEHHDFFVNAYGGFSNLPRNDKSRVDEITNSIATIVNAPTIIEADRSEEE